MLGEKSDSVAPTIGHAETPASLAVAIARRLARSERARWLDPCVGSGSLVRGMFECDPLARVTAVDLLKADPPRAVNNCVKYRWGTDFIRWAQRSLESFDRIIANPPYVPISRLAPSLRAAALEITGPCGLSVRGTANYWYAFVLACLRVLETGGSIGLILPAAWEYADFASEARHVLPKCFGRFEVHRSVKPLFDDVQDGCIVLIGEGYLQPHRSVAERRYRSLAELNSGLLSPASGSSSAVRPGTGRCAWNHEHPHVKLSEVAAIRIGAVTGDVSFFVLTESRRVALGLPEESVRPVLSKASHLTASEIDRNAWESLRRADRRVWLFDPPDALVHSNARVRGYMELTADHGGCNKSAGKISARAPWYRVHCRDDFDGFLSGMTTASPWIAFNRLPRLTITNTLYGIRFHGNPSDEVKAAWALSLLTSGAQSELANKRRSYPQGLPKLEPSDLSSISLIRPKRTDGAIDVYHRSVEEALAGNLANASQLADKWFAAAG